MQPWACKGAGGVGAHGSGRKQGSLLHLHAQIGAGAGACSWASEGSLPTGPTCPKTLFRRRRPGLIGEARRRRMEMNNPAAFLPLCTASVVEVNQWRGSWEW